MDLPHRELGTRIYLLRLSQGLSAVALAKAIGCTPSMVFNWESGREMPPTRFLKQLARVLRVPEAELLQVA